MSRLKTFSDIDDLLGATIREANYLPQCSPLLYEADCMIFKIKCVPSDLVHHMVLSMMSIVLLSFLMKTPLGFVYLYSQGIKLLPMTNKDKEHSKNQIRFQGKNKICKPFHNFNYLLIRHEHPVRSKHCSNI